MSDHPIIFSAPMVRALFDGRKTMTRRLAWREVHRLDIADPADLEVARARGWKLSNRVFDGGSGSVAEPCAMLAGIPSPWQRVQPGDRLWVREAWRTLHKWDCLAPRQLANDPTKITFEADPERRNPLWAFGKLRPSIHMPRWASRLTLTVTATKIERLHDISDADIRAEGGEPEGDENWWRCWRRIWTSLHGADSWDANPELVCPTFAVAKQNIDASRCAA